MGFKTMNNLIKKQARELKWKVFFPLFRKKFRNSVLNRELIDEYGGSNIDRDKLLSKKKSDTLFILAAGQSINNLSEKDFNIISEHDSIAINGFGCHGFIPNFYSFELEFQMNRSAPKIFIDMCKHIIKNIKKYEKTTFIFRQNRIGDKDVDDFVREILSKGNSYWNVYDTIPGKTIKEYESYLLWYKKIGLFKANDFFPNKSSSLSWIISMAYQMRYKNIVFCGVDLFGDHFYNNSKELDNRTFQENKSNLHRTGSVTQNGVAVQDIIKIWQKHLFNDFGSNLFTSSNYSLLAEFLPVYKFDQS